MSDVATVLGLIGCTIIYVRSSLFVRMRALLPMHDCSLCNGFWVGAIYGSFFSNSIVSCFLLACTVSMLALFAADALKLIETLSTPRSYPQI